MQSRGDNSARIILQNGARLNRIVFGGERGLGFNQYYRASRRRDARNEPVKRTIVIPQRNILQMQHIWDTGFVANWAATMLGLGMADEKQPGVSRTQVGVAASELRDRLVKEQLGKERAATDAKTARLRALRLAREAEETLASPPPRPTKKKKTGN